MSDSSPALLDASHNTDHDSDHALTGKIARLPGDLREQINQRLFDGHSDPEILPWLNELPVVKEILAAKFKGQPITKQNMTNWRQKGYLRWLNQKQNIVSLENLGTYADRLTRAGAGRLAPAAAAVASGKLIQFLDTANAADPAQTDPNNLVKCAAAASVLLKMEQNNERLKIAQERLRQHYMALRLKRDKQQRTDAAVALRVLKMKSTSPSLAAPNRSSGRKPALTSIPFPGILNFCLFFQSSSVQPGQGKSSLVQPFYEKKFIFIFMNHPIAFENGERDRPGRCVRRLAERFFLFLN